MVDILGHLDSTILHGFGYEDKSTHNGSATAKGEKAKSIVVKPYSKDLGMISNSSLISAYSYAYDRGMDLLSLITRVDKETANIEGKTSKDMIGYLWQAIKDEMRTEMITKGSDVYSEDLRDDLYKEIKEEIEDEEK